MKELNFLDTFQKNDEVQGPEAFPESRTDCFPYSHSVISAPSLQPIAGRKHGLDCNYCLGSLETGVPIFLTTSPGCLRKASLLHIREPLRCLCGVTVRAWTEPVLEYKKRSSYILAKWAESSLLL